MGTEFHLGRYKEFCACMGCGDGCTKLWKYLMPFNCNLKNGKDDQFYAVYILPQQE